MFGNDSPIEFLCDPKDWDVIPKPYRANGLMPDWYRKLPGKLQKLDILKNSTIKRCAPVLDAMVTGWIIPLAADVEFKVRDGIDAESGLPEDKGLGNVSYSWSFYKAMVENHSYEQIGGKTNPTYPRPPMKFLNYWAIKAKPGWSVLFVPPLNRPDPRFECMSGFVDCDGYFEFVNFPFMFNQPNYTGIIKAGTPLVQAIPIKRSNLPTKANIRKFEQEDFDRLELTRRKRASHESHYRDNVWQKK